MPGQKRGTSYRKYSQENLEKALVALREEGFSYGAAAKEFGVPKSTLKDYARGKSVVGKKAGRSTSIPQDIENVMVDKVIEAANQGFPLTKKQFLAKVGTLGHTLNLKTQFKNGLPSDEYWRCLKRRRPDLSIRNPEACATNRMRGMNAEVVGAYFKDLSTVMTDLGLDTQPECVWNADETGVQFSPGTAKVIAKKGCKQLYSRTANTRDSVTVLVCVNASGRAMPPLFVTKGKTMRSVQSFATHNAPQGSVWAHQQNAWMDNAMGVEWFKKVFLKHCGPRRPQLLIMDSHASHEVVELLELARQENVHILALPPHTTHHLQPLDKVVFGPFKKAHKRYVTEFMSAHPELTINKITWPSIINQVWNDVMTEDLLKKSFEATGIFPVDKTRIHPDAFAPSIALARVQPTPETALEEEIDIQMAEEEQEVDMPADENAVQEEAMEEVMHMEEANHLSVPDFGDVATLPITADDVAGLQGLTIQVEGGDPIFLDLNGLGDLPITNLPNSQVNNIFGVKAPPPKPATNRKSTGPITSHRLLTSDEIFHSKLIQQEEKERKEQEKKARKEKAEEKKRQKLLKVEHRPIPNGTYVNEC